MLIENKKLRLIHVLAIVLKIRLIKMEIKFRINLFYKFLNTVMNSKTLIIKSKFTFKKKLKKKEYNLLIYLYLIKIR